MKRLFATILILATVLMLCACGTPAQEPKFVGVWEDEIGENILVLEQDGKTLKAIFNGVEYEWEMAPQPTVSHAQPKYTVLYDTINFYEAEDLLIPEVIAPLDPTDDEEEPTEPSEGEEEAAEPSEGEEVTEPVEGEEAEATEGSDVAVASEIPEVTEEATEPEATEEAPEATEEATEPEATEEVTEEPEATEAETAEEAERVILFTGKLIIKDGKMTLVLVDATGKQMCTLIKRY